MKIYHHFDEASNAIEETKEKFGKIEALLQKVDEILELVMIEKRNSLKESLSLEKQ